MYGSIMVSQEANDVFVTVNGVRTLGLTFVKQTANSRQPLCHFQQFLKINILSSKLQYQYVRRSDVFVCV